MNLSPANIKKLTNIINIISIRLFILKGNGLNFDLKKINDLKNAIKLKNQDMAEHEFKNFFKDIIEYANYDKKIILEKQASEQLQSLIKNIYRIINNNNNYQIQAIDSLKEELINAIEQLKPLIQSTSKEDEVDLSMNLPDFSKINPEEKNIDEQSNKDNKYNKSSSFTSYDKKKPQAYKNPKSQLFKYITKKSYNVFDSKKFDKTEFILGFNDNLRKISLLDDYNGYLNKFIPVNIRAKNSENKKIDEIYYELYYNYRLYFVKITFFENNEIEITDASDKAEDMLDDKINQYKKTYGIFSILTNQKKHKVSISDDKSKTKKITYRNLPSPVKEDNKKFYKIMTIDFINKKNSIDIFYDTKENIEKYVKKNKNNKINFEFQELILEENQQNHMNNIFTTKENVIIKDTNNQRYTQNMSIAYNEETSQYSVFLSENQEESKSIKPSELFNTLNSLIKSKLKLKNLQSSKFNNKNHTNKDDDKKSLSFFIGNSSNNKNINELQELGIIFDTDNFYFIKKSDCRNFESIEINDYLFISLIKKEKEKENHSKSQSMRSNIKFKTKNKNDIILDISVELSDNGKEYNFFFNEVNYPISSIDSLIETQTNPDEYTKYNNDQIKKLYKLFKIQHNHLIEKENDDVNKFIEMQKDYSNINANAFSDSSSSEDEQSPENKPQSKHELSSTYKSYSEDIDIDTNLTSTYSDKALKYRETLNKK